MARIYNPNNLAQVERGDRLGDIHALVLAIKNINCLTSAYNIVPTGSTQANSVQLIDVLNEVDTAAPGTGVQLPSTIGKENTPFQICILINNSSNSVQVYGRYGTSDLINNIAGSTGIAQSSATTNLYVSSRNGYWFSISGSGGGGGGSGITRSVQSVSIDTIAAATANTDYVYLCSGTMNLTLPTPVGNTNLYTVTNVGVGTVTVVGTIDGVSNLPILAGNSFDFISNTSSWNIT